MSIEPSPLRERIHKALEAHVDEAEKLLGELPDADSETKLSILISGWGRGLAAALEELAIAVDELRQAAVPPIPEPVAPPPAQPEPLPEPTEEEFLDDAAKSREATAKLRQESEQARQELEQ
jgi:hypothetical protein